MIFNTHSHLNDESFFDIEEEIIEQCYAKQISLLVVGYNTEMNHKAVVLAEKYENVYAAIGIHPTESQNFESDLAEIMPLYAHPKVVAVGECGLDYHWDTVDPELQKESFRAQIRLAKALKKPVIIHMRDAAEDTLKIIKEEQLREVGGVMHCYSGSVEMSQDYMNENLYISLAGPVTFKNAKVPKEVAEKVPLDKLLVETDDPWLSPEPYRGKQNKAHYVTYVVEQIAKIKGITVQEVADQTTKNALRLFQLEED